MANHVHHDALIAYAKGAQIQLESVDTPGEWYTMTNPVFAIDRKYRVKPKEKIKKYQVAYQYYTGVSRISCQHYKSVEDFHKYVGGVAGAAILLPWTLLEVEAD